MYHIGKAFNEWKDEYVQIGRGFAQVQSRVDLDLVS